MKKNLAILIFVGMVCTAIALVFFLQHTRTRETADRNFPETSTGLSPGLSETAGLKKTPEAMPPEKSEMAGGTDSTEKTAKKAVVSAVLNAMTGRPDMKGLSEKKLFCILLDRNAPQGERYHAAWALAKNGSESALKELEKILSKKDTPAYLKAAVAEGLGYSSNPRAKKLLSVALENENDIVVCGAIRGLSAIGDSHAVFTLSGILNSSGESETVIAAAAAGLGGIDSPDAYLALINAYRNAEALRDDSLQQDIISALGYRDLSETKTFFQDILNQSDTDASLRLAAIEAIEDAQGDTGAFLANYLNDTDSEIRAEAAWALAATDAPGDLAQVLQSRLAMEQDAEVRKRLYQALGNQENPNLDAAAGSIFKETDLEARLAGYDLLARGLKGSENAALSEQFKTRAIPELQEVALSDVNLNVKLSAVITLKRANTSDSLRALEEIAAHSLDYRVVEATGLNK